MAENNQQITRVTNSVDNAVPKAVPITLDVSNSKLAIIDLTQLIQQGRIDGVQTVFVDNTTNSEPFSLQVQGLAQTLIVPPQAQAYLPILARVPTQIICYSLNSSASAVPLVLLNVPMPAAVWFPFSDSAFKFDGSGNLLVAVENTLSATNPTYSGGFTRTTAVVGYDVILQGSATKLVKVWQIDWQASGQDLYLFRLSAVSGGTVVALTPAQLDSNDAAPTAVLNAYSAAPTVTEVAQIAGYGPSAQATMQFGAIPGTEPLTLRGTGEYIGIKGGLTSEVTGRIVWTEE
jgi:hypothetical protein